MSLTRKPITYPVTNPFGDARTLGSGVTNFGTGASDSLGGTGGRRIHQQFLVENYLAKVSSVVHSLLAQSSALSGSHNIVCLIHNLHQHEIVETQITGAVYKTGSSWTTGYSQTNGANSAPGHDTLSSVRNVFAAPVVGDANVTLGGMSVDVINAGMLSILAQGLTGANQVIAPMYCLENESAAGSAGATVTCVMRENTLLTKPSLTFVGNLFPYGFFIKNDEFIDQLTPNSFRMNFDFGGYPSLAGDRVRFRYGRESDLSDATTTDWVDATTLSDGQFVRETIELSGGTIYWQIEVEVGPASGTKVAYYGDILSQSLDISYSDMPSIGMSFLTCASRADCDTDEINIRASTDIAFGASDYFYVIHGTSSGVYTESTGLASLPTTRRADYGVKLTGRNRNVREYGRLINVVSGIHYRSPEFQVGQLPLSGEICFLASSDLHAHTCRYEEEGVIAISGPAIFYLPQTYRSQVRDMAYARMLLERGKDGQLPLFQLNGGDYVQAHLASTLGFTVNEDGMPVSGAYTYARSQQDMDRVTASVALKEILLHLIQLLIILTGNHEGGHASGYGNSTSVVGKNTLTSPEINFAEWTLIARKKYLGCSNGAGVFVGDSYGRWGYFDVGDDTRIVWIDPYLYSRLKTADPNTLPTTLDDADWWTIGSQLEFLFNSVDGAIRTCERRNILFFTHNFTSSRDIGGPGKYCWSWFDVASPRGSNPLGEWAGGSSWKAADPYGWASLSAIYQEAILVGVMKMFIKYTPSDAMLEFFTGHKHFLSVERPHDGIGHTSMGRLAGGGDDLVSAGPNGRGHRLTTTNGKSFSEADTLFESSNSNYLRFDCGEGFFRVRVRKVFSGNFSGQNAVGTGVEVNPLAYEIGNIMNPGPNAITDEYATAFEFTAAQPDYPLPSVIDAFDGVEEDSVVIQTVGTEQLPSDPYQVSRHKCSNLRAQWKTVTTGDFYLAIRNGRLTSKHPLLAGADIEWQEIRRTISTFNRQVSVRVKSSAVETIVRIAGPDTDSWTTGAGLVVKCLDGDVLLVFDDGSEVELGSVTQDLSDFVNITVVLNGANLSVTVGVQSFVAQLEDEQLSWLQQNGSWVGLSAATDNIDSGIAEFLDFSATSPASVSRRPRLEVHHV